MWLLQGTSTMFRAFAPKLVAGVLVFLAAIASAAASSPRGLVIVPDGHTVEDRFDGGTTVVPQAQPASPIEPIAPQPETSVPADPPVKRDDPSRPGTAAPQARPSPPGALTVESEAPVEPANAGYGPSINSPPITGNKVALVIGNSEYRQLQPLKNPQNDARAISNLMISMGFETWTGLNLSQADTLALVARFAGEITNADIVMFYYAGHAVQAAGSNYIIPVDVQTSAQDIGTLRDQAIHLDTLLGILEATSGSRIVFLDSCRNNPFTLTRQLPVVGERIVSGSPRGIGLARVEARAGTMINYATAPGAVSMDGTGENSPFTEAVVKHLATPGLPLEMAMVRVRAEVAAKTDYQQIPWSHSSLLREIVLVPGEYVAERLDVPDGPSFADLVRSEALPGDTINVNGNAVRWMGEGGGLLGYVKEGVNFVEARGRRFRLWVEGKVARRFPDAYSESHAVLVAIDDYPSASGFPDLGFMESNAEKLAERLETMGFPQDNITRLYGPEATRDAIQGALSHFWGRDIEDRTSRVVIYFGGHGTHLMRAGSTASEGLLSDGLLIPYDYDPNLPYHSSIVLEELRDWNIKRTRMHHTLILIDACSSGLVLPKMLSGGPDEAVLVEPGRWQTIQANLRQPHSGIIVAGTGDEKALWLNGGIFTRSLISGLDGRADINKDGLIEFEELSFDLFKSVRGASLAEGIEQTPSTFSTGTGRIFFELPQR